MDNNLFLEELKKGKRHAVEQLVLTYRDSVYRTCLAYIQNRNDAEDLTQEVFIKSLERIDQFKGESKLSSWIIRIAINLSLNYLRDNKKRLSQIDLSNVQVIEQDKNVYDNEHIAKVVRLAVYRLPEKQRRVFILSFYLNLSYKEIAEVTEYSISSIESLLFRARNKLKELLQKFYDELKN